ncbi:hypothetical protein AAC387_Pa08g2361 [Persea americana]
MMMIGREQQEEEEKKKKKKVEISIGPFPGAECRYSIWDREKKNPSYDNYVISIGDGQSIVSTYCNGYNSETIADWLADTQRIYRRHRHYLLVGVCLDRQHNKQSSFTYHYQPKKKGADDRPYTVLTLCVGSHSIVIFLGWDNKLPKPFRDFVKNPRVYFVGVDMEKKKKKLEADRGILLEHVVDMLPEAEKSLGEKIIPGGMHNVAAAVLGEKYEVEKPERVRVSDYERDLLPEQVKYACYEAFLAFEVGKKLLY